MRAVPFRWQVSSSWSQISRAPAAIERLAHEAERVLVHALVVVAPGIGHARDRQAVLVLLVRERDAVALLRHVFADDLQADRMVVALHLVDAAPAPQRPRLPESVPPHSAGSGPWLM